MKERPKSRRWRRVSVGLLVVATATGASLVVRYFMTPAPIRAAARILTKNDPNFDPNRFDAKILGKSADGRSWRVRFERVDRSGRKQYNVNVPDQPFRLSDLWSWMFPQPPAIGNA